MQASTLRQGSFDFLASGLKELIAKQIAISDALVLVSAPLHEIVCKSFEVSGR